MMMIGFGLKMVIRYPKNFLNKDDLLELYNDLYSDIKSMLSEIKMELIKMYLQVIINIIFPQNLFGIKIKKK